MTTTNDPTRCETCGRPVPREAPGGLCPACVGEGLFADDDAALVRGEFGHGAAVLDGYRLLALAGEGGFGLVYRGEAADGSPVALKILKPGMDSAQVLARFEAERQALALLDHPGIARVLDAGLTESGRPYFAMEWVPGETLDAHCRRRRPSLEATLALFVRICHALEHAHQRGILHRDLKPGNVLVTPEGEPRVIDFGLARATDRLLTDKSLWTRLDQLLGTPQYMSPEQAAAGAAGADTRTDVFGLGALLYEMLTGRPPLEAEGLRHAALDEVVRRIREEEPPRPSTLAGGVTSAERRRMAGELDWIVLRALAKDRSRRYASVSSLREDVERFLRHEAVAARPPTRWYAARKFVRRHRVAVSAGVAVVAALASTAVVAAVGARREARAKQETRTAYSEADVAAAAVHFAAERTAEGVAHLVRAVRTDAGNAEAARRLLMAMAEAPVALPAAPPMSHAETVFHVSFLGDGTRVLTGSTRDGTAHVWDWAPGSVTRRHTLTLPGLVVLSASADGGTVAGGSLHGRVQVWRAADGQPVWEAPRLGALGGRMVRGCLLSPDGKSLFTAAHDGGLRAFRVQEGTLRWQRVRAVRCQNVALSPDGTLVAGCFDDGTLLLCAADDGTVRAEAKVPARLTSAEFLADGRILAAAGQSAAFIFRPDGQLDGPPLDHGGRIYSARAATEAAEFLLEGDDGVLDLWRDGGLVARHGFPGPVYAGDFAPHGGLLAAGTREPDARLVVLDRADGSLVGAPASFQRSVHAVSWHPDGRWLAVASRTPSAQVFDTRSRRPVVPRGRVPATAAAPIVTAWFASGGKEARTPRVMALTGDGALWRWDGAAPEAGKVATLPAAVAPSATWQDARHHLVARAAASGVTAVATVDGAVHVVSAAGPVAVGRLPEVPVALALDAAGTTLVAASAHGLVSTWSTVAAGRPAAWQGPPEPTAVAVHAETVAVAGADGTLWVHGPDGTEKSLPATLGGAVQKLAFSPDGRRLFAGGAGHHGQLIDVAAGRVVAELQHLDAAPRAGLCGTFLPDGRHLVTWGSDDLRARVWDAVTGRSAGRAIDHPHGPHWLAVSADASLVASWCVDRTVRVFSAPGRREAALPVDTAEPAAALAFSPGGEHLLVALTDGSLALHPVAPRPTAPLPECFLKWCEAAVRASLRPDHALAEPTFAEFAAARAEVQALPGDSPAVRWMRWLAADPAARSPAP